MNWTMVAIVPALLGLGLGLLTSCAGKTFDMGVVQYYPVSPRVPSHVTTAEEAKKYLFEPYAEVWGMLGTVREDGPKMKPMQIVIGGRHYPITNLKTSNRDHEFYYMFEVRDREAMERLPVDMMTGNLFATEPEKRKHVPIRIVFAKPEDGSTWVGVGKIEHQTMLTRDAMEREIEAR